MKPFKVTPIPPSTVGWVEHDGKIVKAAMRNARAAMLKARPKPVILSPWEAREYMRIMESFKTDGPPR
jgi:hypothetical protein